MDNRCTLINMVTAKYFLGVHPPKTFSCYSVYSVVKIKEI